MDEMLFLSASEVARRLGRKEISARELTELLFARIDAVNPRLNAVAELRREEAMREASAADAARARGDALEALTGVPMTIKDGFNVAGLHTTWGNPAFKNFVADSDATVVRRLRRSGAVIAGKTNVAFMLGDFGQTANDLYGVTNNPWDTARSPGGSSGGAAAAVSTGLTFLEYASDVVGSIRIPASFCGVYGLKPSVGVVPLTGFQPPGTPAPVSDMTYMSTLGPLARSPDDLRTALRATGGPEGATARAYAWSLAKPRHASLPDYRVGVVLDDPRAPVSSDFASVLSNVVDALARAGATVDEGWPEGVDSARSYESFGFHVGLFFAFQQPGEDFASLTTVVEQEHRRVAYRSAWNAYFRDFDVFVCPVNFTAAFPRDTRAFDERTIATSVGERPYADQAFWVSHASLPGLPAVAAPIGRTADRLPVGAQIVGPLYEDDTPITLAELLRDLVGGFEAPPL